MTSGYFINRFGKLESLPPNIPMPGEVTAYDKLQWEKEKFYAGLKAGGGGGGEEKKEPPKDGPPKEPPKDGPPKEPPKDDTSKEPMLDARPPPEPDDAPADTPTPKKQTSSGGGGPAPNQDLPAVAPSNVGIPTLPSYTPQLQLPPLPKLGYSKGGPVHPDHHYKSPGSVTTKFAGGGAVLNSGPSRFAKGR